MIAIQILGFTSISYWPITTKSADCDDMVKRFAVMCANWKIKGLSSAGKLQLLKCRCMGSLCFG